MLKSAKCTRTSTFEYKSLKMLNTLFQFLSLTGMVLLVAVSCNSKPTVVEKVDDHSHTPGKLVSDNAPDAESARTVHEVVVKEVLNASRYTYLNVDEEGEN